MIKDILISIQRQHNENIHKGIKKEELRKSIPQSRIAEGGFPIRCFIYEPKTGGGCGAVVGYFMLDRINAVDPNINKPGYAISKEFLRAYAAGKRLYGWSITQNAFYMSPRPLSDFKVTRPPQSWQYINSVAA